MTQENRDTHREHPILFSAPMVRAILEDRKTQTRRIVSPKDIARAKCAADCTGPQPDQAWADPGLGAGGYLKVPCADGAAQRVRYRASIGDRLWVRETWTPVDRLATGYDLDDPMAVGYAADRAAIRWAVHSAQPLDTYAWNWDALKWKPSIFMPRWASRIDLLITSVRVERLQVLTEEDAAAEGVTGPVCNRLGPGFGKVDHVREFKHLWDLINGERASWASNPWVWVIGFRRLEAVSRAA